MCKSVPNGNEIQASVLTWQHKTARLKALILIPVELCALHLYKRGKVEERGCSSFRIPPTVQLPVCSVGIELHGQSGKFNSLELLSSKPLKRTVLHNLNVFHNTAHYS